MKSVIHNQYLGPQGQPLPLMTSAEERKPLVTRFGDAVDVRNRGALRMSRFAGSQTSAQVSPAVVRLWSDEQFHELSAHQARALAAQLLAAAALTDKQNGH